MLAQQITAAIAASAQMAAASGGQGQDLADTERGTRIRSRREDLHLTQPAVVDLLEKAAYALPRSHDLHPDNAGKPPVTLRGFQTYEQGGGIVWEKAKLLAKVLQLDVQELMHGPADDETPDPFPSNYDAERFARMEDSVEAHATIIRGLLAEQSALLEEIRTLTSEVRDLLTENQQVKAQTDELWPLMRQILEGQPRPGEAADRREGPGRSGSAKKKPAAAKGTR